MTKTLDSTSLAVTAARAAADKKAADTVVLDMAEHLGITDYFVIASGTNDRQVRTIAEEIEVQIKRAGGAGPLRVEGLADATWVLLDYGEVVVHVFLEATRRYYDLERLWSYAGRLDWDGPVRRAEAAKA
ncbi:MAG TPA: ribosome silencing factor [Acidimicrobiales bacterium]|nr:ribosome silencing factor [Acidimicrobiales bacterium]